MLDSFLIHRAPFAVDTSRQILDSSLIVNSRVLKLDTFRHLSIHQALWFSIYRVSAKIISFSTISLDRFSLLSHPNSSNSTLSLLHLIFCQNQVFFIWYDLISLLYHAFHSFLPKFWVFSKLMRFLLNFWVGFCLNELKHHALHYICIITMYHAF